MKRALIILLFCCTSSVLFSQERQFPVKEVLQFVGKGTTGMKLTEWGLNSKFEYEDKEYVDKSEAIYTYINQTRWGSFKLSFGIKNLKLTAISWTEFIAYEEDVHEELKELGFVAVYDSKGNFVNFQNSKLKISATVYGRSRTRDVFITLSTFN